MDVYRNLHTRTILDVLLLDDLELLDCRHTHLQLVHELGEGRTQPRRRHRGKGCHQRRGLPVHMHIDDGAAGAKLARNAQRGAQDLAVLDKCKGQLYCGHTVVALSRSALVGHTKDR